MILRDIKKFIDSQRVVSLQQLARHFHTNADALLPMLDIWQRKGVIRQCANSQLTCKKSCGGCQPNNMYFESVDSKQ